MQKKYRDWLVFGLFLSFIIASIFVIVFYGPSQIVDYIGVNNSFLIIFLFAMFGGVSSFTSASFYTTLGAFYLGGLNPFILVLLGAIGLTIGDCFFYYLGLKGYHLGKRTKYEDKIGLIKKKFQNISTKWKFVFIFLYAGISLFPKDLLCFTLGLVKNPFWYSMIPMFLGNTLFNALFLLLISKGINL